MYVFEVQVEASFKAKLDALKKGSTSADDSEEVDNNTPSI